MSCASATREALTPSLWAIGAHLAKRVDIPAREAGKILDAVSFEQASLAEEQGLPPPKLGRRVAIYGGGNTAMDAARTARRPRC